MTGSTTTAINISCITQGKILHDPWQRDATDLQGEMNMVCDTAESMDAKTKPYRPFLEQKIEATAIGLIEEDWLAGIATQHDVVKRTGIMDSGFARHRLRIGPLSHHAASERIAHACSLLYAEWLRMVYSVDQLHVQRNGYEAKNNCFRR